MNNNTVLDITLLPDMLNASHDMIFIIELATQKIVICKCPSVYKIWLHSR
jgi:hypothetical protein